MSRRHAVVRAALVAFAALVALACGRAEPVLSCDAVGPATPICGFTNPEDLELLPDGSGLVVSEFGAMDGKGVGAIARLGLASGSRGLLWRGGDVGALAPGWGDPACPGVPKQISPHGIHLSRRPDGAQQLLVVNHAGRESVELFELIGARGDWRLEWRGCAIAPEGAWLNDVVALPEGGFLATSMLPRREGTGQILEYAKAAVLGMPTGHALEWRPGRGWAPLPGSDVVFANGIALSPDGRTVFLNASVGGKVHRIDRSSGAETGSADVSGPDNSTWAPDGRLLVASFTGPLWSTLACDGLEVGACPVAFEIVAVDPATLATETLYRGEGAPMGGGTVGLRVGDELFIGSFAGDRILRVQLGAAAPSRPAS